MQNVDIVSVENVICSSVWIYINVVSTVLYETRTFGPIQFAPVSQTKNSKFFVKKKKATNSL